MTFVPYQPFDRGAFPNGQGHMQSNHISVACRTFLEQDRHIKCIEHQSETTSEESIADAKLTLT